jgi:hypothetical protein
MLLSPIQRYELMTYLKNKGRGGRSGINVEGVFNADKGRDAEWSGQESVPEQVWESVEIPAVELVVEGSSECDADKVGCKNRHDYKVCMQLSWSYRGGRR